MLVQPEGEKLVFTSADRLHSACVCARLSSLKRLAVCFWGGVLWCFLSSFCATMSMCLSVASDDLLSPITYLGLAVLGTTAQISSCGCVADFGQELNMWNLQRKHSCLHPDKGRANGPPRAPETFFLLLSLWRGSGKRQEQLQSSIHCCMKQHEAT